MLHFLSMINIWIFVTLYYHFLTQLLSMVKAFGWIVNFTRKSCLFWKLTFFLSVHWMFMSRNDFCRLVMKSWCAIFMCLTCTCWIEWYVSLPNFYLIIFDSMNKLFDVYLELWFLISSSLFEGLDILSCVFLMHKMQMYWASIIRVCWWCRWFSIGGVRICLVALRFCWYNILKCSEWVICAAFIRRSKIYDGNC